MDNLSKPRSKKRPQARAMGLPGLALIEIERAAGDLRAGFPVVVTDGQTSVFVLSAETMNETIVHDILMTTGPATPFLLLTRERAQALKIRLYTPDVLAIPIKRTADAVFRFRDLADPSRDLSNPLRGPFNARRDPLPNAAQSVLRLMKIANLLPAAIAWFLEKKTGDGIRKKLGLLSVSAQQIDGYQGRAASELQLIAQANLPLANAPKTRILAFRPQSGAREHLILLIGNPSPERPPLVRIHSECFTGDLLGSLKCDCGDQLRGAIRRMGEDKAGGVLLYLAQEGRGIGLINKLRAYDLQDQGFDTVDANTRLGFESDERQFSVAAALLKRLGYASIRLLTNNPGKVESLYGQGINVIERVPHAFPSNPHNADYLKVKAAKSGHLL
jgi:GTP cyclohydrolase II